MDKYNVIKQTFAHYECQLLTTYEEYIENKLDKTKYSQFKIIAICGHVVPNCWYHMFKYRGTCLLCKDCTDNNHKEHSKECNKKHNLKDNINSQSLSIENDSINLIKKYIDNSIIDICKTGECCVADLMIRDSSITDDKWLPVQVKSTLKGRHNIYSFGIYNNYPNMVIILVCIEEEKFWIINGNQILNQCKVSIGMQKSNKYAQYSVKKEDLGNKLKELYYLYTLDTFNNINTPITPECKKEQEYRLLRETYLPNIKFVNSPVNRQVYDFTINNIKVQEKVAYVLKKNNISMVIIAKNKKGLKNQQYEVGDNDFYWINIPETSIFYLIPESIMIQNNLLYKENSKGTTRLSFGNNWTINYKYSYKDHTIEEKLNKIFDVKTKTI